MRKELLAKIESYTPQERFEHFEELSRLSDKLVYSGDPIKVTLKGNVGLELEYRERDTSPWMYSSVDGFDNGHDCSWRELRLKKVDIAYGQRWLNILPGARTLLTDSEQLYKQDTVSNIEFKSSGAGKSMHIHFDQRHVYSHMIASYFDPFFHAIRDNDLGTWEVRGLCPPVTKDRGLDCARIADLAELGLASKSLYTPGTDFSAQITLSDRLGSHSAQQLMWGHFCSRTNDPGSLLAALMALKNDKIFSVYLPSSLVGSFSDNWSAVAHLRNPVFTVGSVMMKQDWASSVWNAHNQHSASCEAELNLLRHAYLSTQVEQLPDVRDTYRLRKLEKAYKDLRVEFSPFIASEVKPLLKSSVQGHRLKGYSILESSGDAVLLQECKSELLLACKSNLDSVRDHAIEFLGKLGQRGLRLSSVEIRDLVDVDDEELTSGVLSYLREADSRELIRENREFLREMVRRGLREDRLIANELLDHPGVFSDVELLEILQSGDQMTLLMH